MLFFELWKGSADKNTCFSGRKIIDGIAHRICRGSKCTLVQHTHTGHWAATVCSVLQGIWALGNDLKMVFQHFLTALNTSMTALNTRDTMIRCPRGSFWHQIIISSASALSPCALPCCSTQRSHPCHQRHQICQPICFHQR